MLGSDRCHRHLKGPARTAIDKARKPRLMYAAFSARAVKKTARRRSRRWRASSVANYTWPGRSTRRSPALRPCSPKPTSGACSPGSEIASASISTPLSLMGGHSRHGPETLSSAALFLAFAASSLRQRSHAGSGWQGRVTPSSGRRLMPTTPTRFRSLKPLDPAHARAVANWRAQRARTHLEILSARRKSVGASPAKVGATVRLIFAALHGQPPGGSPRRPPRARSSQSQIIR
jgi:hypothetical protein